MKKLFLLVYLLSIAAFYGYSQSLSLSNLQGPIVANSTIIQAGTPDSTELITYMNVKNTGTSTLNVFCKKVHVTMMDSVEVTMCWAGACYPSFVNVSPNSKPIDAGQIITDFVGHYSCMTSHGFKSGESIVRWVFYDGANTNDSVSVTVKYTSFPLGVDDKIIHQGILSNIYPNPADATVSFSYAVPSGSQGTIVIRNLVGSMVQTEQVSDGSGKMTLNTASLNDGIYFCSLVLDGKISQTKKLVIKH